MLQRSCANESWWKNYSSILTKLSFNSFLLTLGALLEPTNNVSCPQFIHALTFLANDFTSSVLSSVYKPPAPSSFSWMGKKKGVRKRTSINCSRPAYPPLPGSVFRNPAFPRLIVQILSVYATFTPPQMILCQQASLSSLHLLFLSAWLLLLACRLDMLAPAFMLFSHLIKFVLMSFSQYNPTSFLSSKIPENACLCLVASQFSHFLFELSIRSSSQSCHKNLFLILHTDKPKDAFSPYLLIWTINCMHLNCIPLLSSRNFLHLAKNHII